MTMLAQFSATGGAVANYIEDVFSTYLYTGNGTSQSIVNNIDLSTNGGFVWIKDRTNAYDHMLFDTARGADYTLRSNTTDPQYSQPGRLSTFNTDGFSIGNGNVYTNGSGDNYASWTFRKQPKFFDVVTYTGNGSTQNIAHNLGSAPGCIIVKCTSNAGQDWFVYHRTQGNGYGLLNTTDSWGTYTGYWNNTAPTSTQFSVGTSNGVNGNGYTYVAYLFAHDAGGFGLTGTDNVISCGSFTTNGSGNATLNLGYEPQWFLAKSSSTTQDWVVVDSMRGWVNGGANDNDALLRPNLSNIEFVTNFGEPTATGFNLTGFSASQTYIYIAIRRGPMKVPTDGTKVFAAYSNSGASAPAYVSNFPVDFAINRSVLNSADNNISGSRLTQGEYLVTNLTNAAGTSTSYKFDYNNGWRPTASSGAFSWMFQRAPSFFDEVCFTGTSNSYLDRLNHNLTVAPELIITKKRSATEAWYVYSSSLNGGTNPQNYGLVLNTTAAVVNVNNLWGAITPNSTTFAFYADNGATYVSYLFATCAGVSKVGSYTGTGTTQQINCGFAAGARFVLIKRTDSTGDWYVYDSTRGIVSGNDPYLLLNSDAAQVTSTDYVDTYAAGFELSSTAPAALNASGGTFIFLAIA